MALKTSSKRKTYRSNVKTRPLQFNGLEAFYQGLNIAEANMDHAGLQIIGRGGFQSRHEYAKVQKSYIVTNDQADTFKAHKSITFGHPSGVPYGLSRTYTGTFWKDTDTSVKGYDFSIIALTDHLGVLKTYQFRVGYPSKVRLKPNTVPALNETLTFASSKLTEELGGNAVITFKTSGTTSTQFTSSGSGGTAIINTSTENTVVKVVDAIRILFANLNNYSTVLYDTTSQVLIIGEGLEADYKITPSASTPSNYDTLATDNQSTHVTGTDDGFGKIIVDITNHDSSVSGIIDELISAIEKTSVGQDGHGKGSFQCSRVGETLFIRMATFANTNGLINNSQLAPNSMTPLTSAPFTSVSNENYWALEGVKTIQEDHTKFYEDIRTDYIQSATMHSYKNRGFFLDGEIHSFGTPPQDLDNNWLNQTAGSQISNLDGILSGSAGSGVASIDPTTSGFSIDYYPAAGKINRILSEEVRIKKYPKRDELYNTFTNDHSWKEDPHWISHRQQTWSLLQSHSRAFYGINVIKPLVMPINNDTLTFSSTQLTQTLGGPVVITFKNSGATDNTFTGTAASVDISQHSTIPLIIDAVATLINSLKDYYATEDDVTITINGRKEGLPHELTITPSNLYSWEILSSLERSMLKVLNHIYTPLEYHNDYPMSERCDVFHRVERVFGRNIILYEERHRSSIFDQYLDPMLDFINLQDNSFPKDDIVSRDLPFEDSKGSGSADELKLCSGVINTSNGSSPAIPNSSEKLYITNDHAGEYVISFQNAGGSGTHTVWTNKAATIDRQQHTTVAGIASAITVLLNAHPSFTATVDGTQISFQGILGGSDLNPIFTGTSLYNETTNADGISVAQFNAENYAESNSIMFVDYFDQPPITKEDYIEDISFSHIDSDMLDVLTQSTDRREWEANKTVITATGFINSQSAVQGGIVYREMLR